MLRKLFPLLLLALAACDPCSGLGTCVAPQLRYEGVLTRKFGYPAGGPAEDVTVRFVRTGGVGLESDTLVARSDAEGRFRFESPADAEGQVTGDLWIYPPGPVEPIRSPGMRLATTRAPGEVLRLGEYKIPYPYFGYGGVLYYRATRQEERQPIVGVEAVFRRTGGIPIEPDTFRMVSDRGGVLFIRPKTKVYGEVVGDLTVYPPPPHKEFTLRGLRLQTFITERNDSAIWLGIGSRLPYAIRFSWGDPGRPVEGVRPGEGVEGVEVEFVRTGGVPISPTRWVSRTDRFGTFILDPAPLASGEVVGDLIVRPPAPGRGFTVRDFRLQTVEDDRPYIFIGFWTIPVETR